MRRIRILGVVMLESLLLQYFLVNPRSADCEGDPDDMRAKQRKGREVCFPDYFAVSGGRGEPQLAPRMAGLRPE